MFSGSDLDELQAVSETIVRVESGAPGKTVVPYNFDAALS